MKARLGPHRAHAGRWSCRELFLVPPPPPPPRGQAQRLYGLHKPAGGPTPKEAGIVIAAPPLRRTVAKRCHSIAGSQLAIHSFLHSYYPRGCHICSTSAPHAPLERAETSISVSQAGRMPNRDQTLERALRRSSLIERMLRWRWVLPP